MPTTYDVIDDGLLGGTAFVGPTATAAEAFSKCRCGAEEFAAMLVSGTLEVWHYSGGTRTAYTIGTIGSTVGKILNICDYGPAPIKLRSDDTDVWLVFVEIVNVGSHVVDQVQVAVWNGAGFTGIGTDGGTLANRSFSAAGFNRDQGRIGHLTAAACAAEPGVLHVAWSEAGSLISDLDDPLHPAPTYKQRVSYSKWSNAAIVSGFDVSSASVTADNTYTGVFPSPVITQHLFLTNGSGSPLLFYGPPTANDTIASGSSAGTISYGDAVEMIDVSGGSASVLRTINGSAINAAVTTLENGALSVTIGGSRFPTSPFGTEIVYIDVPWSSSTGPVPLLISGPADGSAAFGYPDSNAAENPGHLLPYTDVVDETRNIWAGINTGSRQLAQYHRDCPDWSFWGHALAACDGFDAGIEFDLDGDTIYTVGRDASDHTKLGVVAIPILRDNANCGGGLRKWHRWS